MRLEIRRDFLVFCVHSGDDMFSKGSSSQPLLAVCSKQTKKFVHERGTKAKDELNADENEPRTGGKGRDKRKETHKDAGAANDLFYVTRTRRHNFETRHGCGMNG